MSAKKKPAKKKAKKSPGIKTHVAVWPKRRPKGVPSILVREITPRIYEWAVAIEKNGVQKVIKKGWEHLLSAAFSRASGVMFDWRRKHRFTYEQEMNPLNRSLFDTGEKEKDDRKAIAAEEAKRRFTIN